MAGPNYGLLDNALVNKNRAVEGYGAVNALVAQNLQNQADKMAIENAMAEKAAGQAAGGDINAFQQNLMKLGRPKEAVAVGKAAAEIGKLDTEAVNTRLKSAASLSTMANTPSEMAALMRAEFNDPYLGKFYTQMGLTPDKAEAMLAESSKTPEGFRQFKMSRVMGLEKMYDQLNAEGQLKVSQRNADISAGHLTLAQQREARLAAGQTGTTLTPEQNEALFGENGAVTRGLIDPMKINSRNAKMWADAYTRNPNANVAQISQDVKAAEGVVKAFASGVEGRKVTAFNTAIDHLDTLEQLGAALKNNDVRLFNELSNRLGAATGQAAPTSFAQASKIVGGEISKAIVPGVGTGKEREEAAHAFNTANSPEQLAGAIATSKKLMGGQLKSLEHQYQRGTKRTDFADTMLTPAARKAYQSAGATAPATTRPAGVGADWQLMTDASGNKAWVSPDKKSFKEVK